MANRDLFAADGHVLTASEVIGLGNTNEGKVGRILLTVHDESSMSISITPKGVASRSTKTKYALGYANANAPDTQINSGSTPITAAGNYLIEASGMSVDIDLTVSSGSVRLMARRLDG